MEILVILFEGLLWLLDVLLVGADFAAWIKGDENRRDRRKARRLGHEVPKRDKWNRNVLILSILVVVTTGMIVYLNIR